MGDWSESVDTVRPHVFRISTPSGRGTGFQLFLGKGMCGVATALHVVSHADDWEEPIRLTHHESGESKLLRPEDRAVFPYPNCDLAFIVFQHQELPLKAATLEVIEPTKRIRQGVEFGWWGFPAVAPNDLCFFTGHVSSWLEEEESYLIDGVAINGVSGGPAFTSHSHLCGVVTAYIPNRTSGESLPGVCLIRDIAPYQEQLEKLQSFEDAQSVSKSSEN